jgi:hypothetical protein
VVIRRRPGDWSLTCPDLRRGVPAGQLSRPPDGRAAADPRPALLMKRKQCRPSHTSYLLSYDRHDCVDISGWRFISDQA